VCHRGQPHRRRAPACCRGRPPPRWWRRCRRRRPLRRALVPGSSICNLSKRTTSAFGVQDLAIEGRLVAGALMAEADGAGGRQLMGASTAATACLRDPQQLWAKWIHKWFVSLISV
ncbi:Os07g0609550, partial [Oryza sativa Japonica Group]